MPMNYAEFLNRVIETGIEGAKQSYADDASKDVARREVIAHKLEGAISGFERCREKIPHELLELLVDAGKNMHRARLEELPDYWKHACFHAEIEWVCNCVSAMLVNEGMSPIIVPTYRGVMQANRIITGSI